MKNSHTPKRPLGRFNLKLALTLSAAIIMALSLFRLLKNFDLYLLAVILYSVVTLAVALSYIIYNKGSISGKVTPDMLPTEWSMQEKQAFIDNLAFRRKNSKWMLVILIPMIIVFGVELLEIYMLPILLEAFPSIASFLGQ